jgi:pimeloyl-ACP methyl ester carboxylesterase
VIAAAYPGFEVQVEALREDRSPIEVVTVPDTVAHLEGIIGGLDEPPILIGHSFGGALVRIVLDHRFSLTRVAIDSVPTEGVRTLPSWRIKASFRCSRAPRTAIGRWGRAQAGSLHVREHAQRRGVRERRRALPRPGAGPVGLERRAGEHRPGSPGHVG